jgi:hypothetical protein
MTRPSRVDEKSGQSNITSMRRVNHEMQYWRGFTILLGMEMKARQISTCIPIHAEGSNAKEVQWVLVGAVNPSDEMRSDILIDAKNISLVWRAGLQPGRTGRFFMSA